MLKSVTESKKAQQEMRKAALDAARVQKKVKKGDFRAFCLENHATVYSLMFFLHFLALTPLFSVPNITRPTLIQGFDTRLANRSECPKVKNQKWSVSQPGVKSLSHSPHFGTL